jgi:cytochrome c oxidase cbb3-type subunit IV
MLRDVIQAVDYSLCAEIALGLFCFAFGLMIYAVLKLNPASSKRYASIPLSDHVEDPRDE